MAVEVVQFLVRKFVDSLAEEEEAAAVELPFCAHFYDVKAELEKAAISSTNADELRQCLYELNDLLAECRMLASRRNTPRPGCFSPSEAWRSSKAKKRVIAVKRRVLQCVQSDYSSGNAAALQEEDSAAAGFSRWTTSWLEDGTIHGFDQQLAELESVVFGADSSVARRLAGVGIVGMGGVGKTALARLVFNSPRARGRFFPRIWVCLSRTAACAGADVRKEVLQSMLMALGLEEEVILSMDNMGEMAFAVHEQLKGKKYLIVFDDVWNVDGWYADVVGRRNASPTGDEWAERLAFGLPKERGGVVVVTSRLEQAAEKMVGKSSLHRLQPLADGESCWAIFMDAFSKERRQADLTIVNSMKDEILDTCGGLPSAAKTLGDIFARSLSSPASTSSQELSKST
uniref:NB-ARC domain-containing protein n=1 Tax=Leersia perrieri TaxID=77586 RepID=A0A0D9V6R9_9ORYZ